MADSEEVKKVIRHLIETGTLRENLTIDWTSVQRELGIKDTSDLMVTLFVLYENEPAINDLVNRTLLRKLMTRRSELSQVEEDLKQPDTTAHLK